MPSPPSRSARLCPRSNRASQASAPPPRRPPALLWPGGTAGSHAASLRSYFMEPNLEPVRVVTEGKAAPAAQGRSLTGSGARPVAHGNTPDTHYGPGVSLTSKWLMRPRGRDTGQRGESIRDSVFAAMRSIMAARRWFHADGQGREGQP